MEIHYEYALKQKEFRDQIISEINASKKPTVLFGWNKIQVLEPFFNKLNMKPEYLCDNDTNKQGRKFFGYKVISPNDLSKIYSHYNVLILAASHFGAMSAQLKSLPIPPQKIYCLDIYNEGSDTAKYYKSQEEKIRYIYDHLADDLSKRTFEAVINYRMYRNSNLLSEIVQPIESTYFPDPEDIPLLISHEEVFVDGGAFCGDTVENFVKKCPGGVCKAIHSFEPDPKNFSLLRESTERCPFVHCYQLGLSDTAATLNFSSSLGPSSYVDDNGTISVEVDSLDSILKEAPVTYIKMDVEGAERAALRGAEHIIQKYNPKLAICVYHSDQDMVEVPLLIWKMNPNYLLYFRHYTDLSIETVCYAVLSK